MPTLFDERNRRLVLILSALGALNLASSSFTAQAQTAGTWPERPIKLVVPCSAGGAAETAKWARVIKTAGIALD